MKVLVTGGAGYVGSHTVRWLSQRGDRVWIYDDLSRGHREAVPADQFIKGDLLDANKLEAALFENGIEAVVHFAGASLVGESVERPDIYYRNNVAGSLSLLEAMRAVGVTRIVFSSTTAVYGTPEMMPITESLPLAPINPYGFSKRCVEQILADYQSAYGFSFAALRYFNAAGASPDGDLGEDHTPESHLIPIVLQVALGQREQIVIFGDDYQTPDGTCIRDYVHVDDLAAAHQAALSILCSPGDSQAVAPQKLFMNLGIGRGYSVREVIDVCRAVTGHEIPAVVGPRRPGDPPELVANSSLAQRELNWQPKYTSLESIVETAWRWHSQHPNGFAEDKVSVES
ncbi:MAG: UDP-glucose 4-epimerase GalE [Pirellulales bacterium]|nr:UDP-glucose 4-epimerase GalE [Pirellulales bacterium]